jgi:hypothetical protein
MLMKKLLALSLIGLLSLGFAGCATGSRLYNDSKVAMIKRNITTETEFVEWFGPPARRTMNEHGASMAWKFAEARPGSPRSVGILEVSLGADGKVVSYSASAGR